MKSWPRASWEVLAQAAGQDFFFRSAGKFLTGKFWQQRRQFLPILSPLISWVQAHFDNLLKFCANAGKFRKFSRAARAGKFWIRFWEILSWANVLSVQYRQIKQKQTPVPVPHTGTTNTIQQCASVWGSCEITTPQRLDLGWLFIDHTQSHSQIGWAVYVWAVS